jgi:hypothetical protein
LAAIMHSSISLCASLRSSMPAWVTSPLRVQHEAHLAALELDRAALLPRLVSTW